MKFFDSHLHCPGDECGGLAIGLEGSPVCAGAWDNAAAQAFARMRPSYFFFRYVTANDIVLSHEAFEGANLLKYHPARERYSADAVRDSITRLRPRAVIIDTLNEPRWMPTDYWRLAAECANTCFIFAHAGGYAVNDFVKICHLQSNVWLDFSLTHSYFGGISKNPLPLVDQAIAFALKARFSDRILMGSDLPFFNQQDVVAYYERMGAIEQLNRNFEVFTEKLNK